MSNDKTKSADRPSFNEFMNEMSESYYQNSQEFLNAILEFDKNFTNASFEDNYDFHNELMEVLESMETEALDYYPQYVSLVQALMRKLETYEEFKMEYDEAQKALIVTMTDGSQQIIPDQD